MYHRVRKKMFSFCSAILILSFPLSLSKSIDPTNTPDDNEVNNNIIDFDEEYTVKFNKKYGMIPWHANEFDKNSLKYTIVKDTNRNGDKDEHSDGNAKTVNLDTKFNDNEPLERSIDQENYTKLNEDTTTEDFRVIPLELLSTTVDPLIALIESTTEQDLTVIPLSTTEKIQVTIDETVTLPTTASYVTEFDITTEINGENTPSETDNKEETSAAKDFNETSTTVPEKVTVQTLPNNIAIRKVTQKERSIRVDQDAVKINNTGKLEQIKSEDQNTTELKPLGFESKEKDNPVFTELDTELFEGIPDDYYDTKDIVPTSAPKTDAISVLFGLAGSVVESVVESVAERVVPKSIFDLFKRMQKQNEALEAERLRSREENGGLGQLGRGILKSISTGLAKPLTQLIEPKENGSLDTDRGFVASVASGVSSVANVANSVLDAFKNKVEAIYPGTLWCGDGHSAQARSSDLGLFFFTDTCCRQHDACKLYITSGETKYGLTNTGLFTRSHCSCDSKFRECLRRTNSLVSAQIGLTYFNVLGPQCFRRAHPIIRCNRKTRITGLKCEEYELDFTKPKMWQWFDNETY